MPDPGRRTTEERIAAYLRGELSAEDRAALEAALDRDPQWLAVVALLARGGDGPSPASPEHSREDDRSLIDQLERDRASRLHPGTRVGRYEIQALLGRGGMGMVYAAHDPELSRTIAIKLLRSTDEARQARLLREARALARLSDRHVITIHDVGTFEGRVFLAMELLEGQTLLAWRSAGPRPWREVLRVYTDAGRGLQAAHAAGLVHRDFKPTNVMITEAGRVVVLDFGLVHAVEGEPSLHDDDTAYDASEEEGTLTRTGQRLGTPAYMAPEQIRGDPLGPRTDQFGFCVALWEALHGRMPPQATHPERLAPFGPATGRIPARLIRLLARGLHPDPALRHASMGELVDALEAVARPRRSWVVALLLAGTAGALVWPSSTPEPTPCTGSDRELERAGTWDELRAAAVSEALARPGLPWSERVREEVDRGLHDYAHAWAREHEAACRATRIDGSESVAVLDLRMLCLDRRRRAFGALVDVLAEADAEVAAQAVQAVDALPSLDGCRDLEALRAPVPLPDDPGDRARADAIFDELGRVEALRQARRFDDALGLATRSVDDAVALGHAPTEADARLARGWVLTDRGELAEAETELRAALHAAEIGRHDHAVTTAWNRLAWVVGYKDARHEEGRRLAAHAEAWSRRHGQDPEAELSRLRTLGWIEHEAGHAERALEHFEAALAVAERLPDDAAIAPQEVALVLNGLGAAALGVADLERASSSFARAGERLEAQLGPDHPDVAQVRNNLSSLLRAQGKSEEARALLAHNLEVFTATFGDEHPLVGQTLINLAVAELDLGLHEASEAHADRALAVLQAAHGPRHPLVSKAHTLRGDARIQLHRPLEAIDDLEHALDIERETLGPEHPSVGIVESNLGGAYYDLERLDEAAEHQLRSIAILEAGLGPEHPNLAFVLTSLGLTRRGQGRPLEALELFRRAERIADPSARADALVRIGETLLELDRVPQAREALEHARTVQGEIEADPGMLGDIGRALARARWAEGEPEAARAAAREAIDAYTRGGDDEQLAEVRRWLAEHSEASR